MPSLLIIDDEPAIPVAMRPGLQKMGLQVRTAPTAELGLRAVKENGADAILLDIGLPDMSGLDLCRLIHEYDAQIPVIFMTGQGTAGTAIAAMKLGAYDYLLKPFGFPQLRELVLQALEVSRLTRTPVLLPQDAAPAGNGADHLVGRSPQMQAVYKMIGRVASLDGTVLIRGESGTGKELVARAIFQHSRRAEGPFLAINCAAIPEQLLESELFGHEKGAFTGAERVRIGKFEQCSGGTLFLDEIGDMTPLTQSKVLRVLQDQQFERVGGRETIRTDVRLIAATHRNLEEMIAGGRFRGDLYYRLNIFAIRLPPLRERRDDIPLLVHQFLWQFGREMQKDVRDVSPEAMQRLQEYHWPGNIRELQSVLKQTLLHAAGPVLLPDFLPDNLKQGPAAAGAATAGRGEQADSDAFIEERLRAGTQNLYTEWFSRMERHLIARVLRETFGNQRSAAAILGITRRSLRNKIRAHGIAIERSVGTMDDDDQEPEQD